ncbi:MAG TPA: aspartate-semialdehyde dehydrogenase [Candidatus Acidoferrales bacterium]|nr:aspartate-semialdehyde dehydrogenase [Candidatus Acidoferrales bacterium]
MRQLRVGVVGATGLVGTTLLRVLEERKMPVEELRLFASERSSGTHVDAFDTRNVVRALDRESARDLEGLDVAFFAAGAQTSRTFAPECAARGTFVIDKSSAFRLDPKVPLVVPEANEHALGCTRLIANPNCATIPLAVALAPIHRRFGLRWVSVATYQSVSGAGKDALEEFERQQAGDGAAAHALPRRIEGNVFPENGPFDESGYGEEERKIAAELAKILEDPQLAVSATSVRVPVAISHAEAVAFEPRDRATRGQIAAALREAAGVTFMDGADYATPLDAAGSDAVFVGRLRPDTAHPGAFLAWVVCDNLRKGAATNAVQIAEAALALRANAPV